jgi:hypothetical protein
VCQRMADSLSEPRPIRQEVSQYDCSVSKYETTRELEADVSGSYGFLCHDETCRFTELHLGGQGI